MKEFRKKFIKEYLEDVKRILGSVEEDLINEIDKLASILIKARENKSTIFIMGNGGSASTASHFVGT